MRRLPVASSSKSGAFSPTASGSSSLPGIAELRRGPVGLALAEQHLELGQGQLLERGGAAAGAQRREAADAPDLLAVLVLSREHDRELVLLVDRDAARDGRDPRLAVHGDLAFGHTALSGKFSSIFLTSAK